MIRVHHHPQSSLLFESSQISVSARMIHVKSVTHCHHADLAHTIFWLSVGLPYVTYCGLGSGTRPFGMLFCGCPVRDEAQEPQVWVYNTFSSHDVVNEGRTGLSEEEVQLLGSLRKSESFLVISLLFPSLQVYFATQRSLRVSLKLAAA